jgi:heme-degrading monooxygenase HmoA
VLRGDLLVASRRRARHRLRDDRRAHGSLGGRGPRLSRRRERTGADGFGITVSYWANEAAIAEWKRKAEHADAQARGQREWYASYAVRIARVERTYTGPRAQR